MTLKITVLGEDYKLLFSENFSQNITAMTPWLKGKSNKPQALLVEKDEEQYPIELEAKINKSGKLVLVAFATISENQIKVIFTYGTDPSRPSHRETIQVKEPKKKVA